MSEDARYKQDWIDKHSHADELFFNKVKNRPVAAIYYYPPSHHEAESKKFWKMVAGVTEVSDKDMEIRRGVNNEDT